ncbi:MAG: HypC/HybG/HupF family hydrogenase formation chaperone [Pseudobutyrivibrio sp.]|nr:HypC/HybG/HupF family hydrogenase formation chaperone [Pseudobutyrivibrio sp.]
MCVAIPGEIVEIKDDTAVVDFSGNKVNAYIGLVPVKVGDFALVHAGCIIQTLKKKEAEEIIELMGDLE